MSETSTSGRRMPADVRAALKAAVLEACLELIAAGRRPGGTRLSKRFPDRGHYTLAELRDELCDEGLIDYTTEERLRGYLPSEEEIRTRSALIRLGLPLPEEVAS